MKILNQLHWEEGLAVGGGIDGFGGGRRIRVGEEGSAVERGEKGR